MKVILQRVTYSGQDIGNDINFIFEINNLAGILKKERWTPTGGFIRSTTRLPNLTLFNHPKNTKVLNIKITVNEKDIIYDDHGIHNSRLSLNIKEGFSDYELRVSVREGRKKALFSFWFLVKDICSFTFQTLWENHPGRTFPCDKSEFKNQCAIRMGVALEKSGIDTSSFDTLYPKRRCWLGHTPGHILAAQELANWIDKNPALFGTKKIIKPGYCPAVPAPDVLLS